MSETLFPAGPVDLEALDQFLMSDASPENCMQLSDLDGFLTGIAIGPELVKPSEWLPRIWGGEEPVFEGLEQARTVIGAIMGRYNEILRVLDTDPEAYDPLFWEGPDGEAIAADWAEGFVDAIRLRPEAWRPLLEDRKANVLLMPILALCSDGEDGSLLEFDLEEDADLLAQAPELIPACVVDMHGFWKELRGRLTAGPGRNDPCPAALATSISAAAAPSEQLPQPSPDAYVEWSTASRTDTMPPTPQRLTELEAMIAAAETNITLLTSAIESRAASGRDATGLQKLRQSTQRRLEQLKSRRESPVDEPTSE